VVSLHHGKINVHSTEGKGTEFVIRLPMGKGHLKPNEMVEPPSVREPAQERGVTAALDTAAEKEVETEATSPGDNHVAITGDGTNGEPGEKKENVVLVVEDNADVRTYIREPLEPYYTVVEAVDGEEGIQKAREIIPDLIISDVMMPKTDGYELCRVLKKDIKTSHIPIIILTAKASDTSIVQGLETGADDYITKPFNTKILGTRIKNLIDLRSQLQEKFQRQMMLQPTEISVSSMDQKFLKELQNIIEKNLSDPDFNVEAFSNKLDITRVTLNKKLQALTGQSPTELIRSYRLKRAAQLLKDNFGNITDVAFEVGFSSTAYFTKCFKEKFHRLPSEYQDAET
jgi:CheY-like chemotaxis protein